MAQTIDISTSTIVIRPSKAVKFDNMMGGNAKTQKNVSFSQKEYANVAKTVVLVGQSLKKLNVNVRDIKKLLAEDKKLQIARDKQEKIKTQRQLREARERKLEARNNQSLAKAGKATAGALNKGAAGAKGLLGALMNSPVGGLFTIASGVIGASAIRKLLDSNLVSRVISSFVGAVASIVDSIGKIPTSTLDKIGLNLGKFITFVGNFIGGAIGRAFKLIDSIPQETFDKFGKAISKFANFVAGFVSDRFGDVIKGLDKIIDKDGNLKFDFGGIIQLLTGVGGLAVTYRYLKNPGKVVTDLGNVLGFFGRMFGGPAGAAAQKLLGMKPGGRMGRDLGTRGNPMHVYVVNQGGGGGGGLDDLLGGGPGIRPQRRFSAPRGGGINSGGNFLSRLMKGGKNQVLARPGSIINESTGRATRMLGGNRQSSVMNALKNAGVSNANRARVLSGMLDQGVAQKIAASGGPRWLQNLRGLGSMGMNLGRGVLSSAKSFGGNLLAGAMTLSGNAMDLAKGVGGSFKSLGGKAVSGISGSLQSLGKGIQNLNPMQALEQIRGGVSTKLDEIMKAEPLINTIKNLKDPKKIKSLVSTVGSKAKPALTAVKNARKALGPFKIPGVDVLIGTLAAVAEIATGGNAGNAILGALGGVLGAAAGTSIGTPGGPPGMFIGALAGGSLGEVAGRALARTLAGILPPGVVNYTGLNGSPLFTDGSAPADPAAVKKARGGKIFGGRPTGDSVPAYLERGEYVLNRKAVSAIGPSNLDAMNFGMFPRFQTGGKVSRQEGWDKFTQWGKEKGAKYPQLVSAQWALESGWGSALSAKNNFFGIKATSSESSANHRTREVVNGKSVYVNANFKNFDTPQDAVDHLVTQWYKNYKSYKGVNNAGSPNEAAAMLKQQGYATDPSYPQKLIELMQSKGVSSGPAYISGDGNSTSGSSAEPNRSGGFMSNLVGFMQRGGRAGGGRMPDDGKKTANTSGSTTPSAGDMNAEGSGKVIVNAAKAAVKRGKRGYASPPCASWVRTVLNATKHSSAKKFTRKADLDPQIGPESAWAQSLESAASFAGSDMGKVIRSQSALKPGDIVLHKNTFGNFGEGAITHVSIASDKKGKILHQSTSGGAPHETNMFKFAAGIRLGGTGSEGEFSDSDTTGPGGSTPGAATSENNYGFLGQQEVLASGGITSQKNIAAMTKGIMALAGDVSKAGGGGIFGGALGGAIQPAPPTGSSNPPNPVSSNQSSANPTSGGGLSLSSTSTVNRNNEAKGDMR